MFDNMMSLIAGDMKDEEPWRQTLPWVLDLSRRAIGQLWINHTGHDTTRGYGSKTKEWQMSNVLQLEAVARGDTDVSFSVEFRKARERTPEHRADFAPFHVALLDNRWTHDGQAADRPGKVSPLGLKFLDALRNMLAGATVQNLNGRRLTTIDAWRAECFTLGLLDPEKPNSTRTLLNKHKRELIAAHRITYQGETVWTL